jgi:hypothetical protein
MVTATVEVTGKRYGRLRLSVIKVLPASYKEWIEQEIQGYNLRSILFFC